MPVMPVGLYQIGVLTLLLAIFLVIALKAHWEDFKKPYQVYMAMSAYLAIAFLLVTFIFLNLPA